MLKYKSHSYKKTALKRAQVYEKNGDGICIDSYICGGQLHNGEQAAACNCSYYPKNPISCYYSQNLKTMFVYNGSIYRYDMSDGGSYYTIAEQTFGDVFYLEYLTDDGAKVACCTGNTAYIYDGENVQTYQFSRSFKSGVYNFGRFLFCDEQGDAVYWSGLGGVDDWNSGLSGCGNIQLENLSLGKILRLLVMGDKLVLVRQSGFTVMRAFGSPENFRVDNLNVQCGQIYEKSVAVAGNKIYFCNEQGLFCFDGSGVEKLTYVNFANLSKIGNACASNSAYYLRCFSKKLNSYAILCVQFNISASYFINLTAAAICFGDRLYAHGNGGTFYCYTPEEANYCYVSKPLGFNAVGNKVLRFVCLPDDAVGEVTVKSELCERTFAAAKCVKVNMAGQNFTLKFTGGCNALQAVAVAEV